MFLVTTESNRIDELESGKKETDSKFTGQTASTGSIPVTAFPERDSARSTVGSAILTC